MKSESGISNRWALLETVIGIKNLKNKFNAYSWYNDNDWKISKSEHWCGWFNDNFDFVIIWAKSEKAKRMLDDIIKVFTDNEYDVGLLGGGISIHYSTRTPQEVHEKAYNNLISGGRMSD